ncbi:MAG: hypothetical protein AAFN10_08895 [Bacteroidota bacterium]
MAMTEQQKHLYFLYRQFVTRTADRLDVRGKLLEFKVGSSTTFGIAASVVTYFVAVLFLLQGYSLHYMVGLGSLWTLVFLTTAALGAIAVVSISARIDLDQRTITRYILGFKIMQISFDELKAIKISVNKLFGLNGGATFILVDKNDRKMGLVTFRKQEHMELYNELLPEVFKAF